MKREFMNRLLSCASVSGYEESLQETVENEMRDCADEIVRDDMNNLVCVLNPKCDTRIMLSAHADEIGLIVTNVLENGTLQVISRGGIVPATYPGQQVCVQTAGGVVYGVVEAYRGLFEKKELGTKDFVIDIGAKDKEDALKYVGLGDPVVLDTHIRDLANGAFSGRGLDDRLGVFIIMEAFRKAKEKGCKKGVYAASTVGEETTKNGAYWSSARIRPDLAVVVDVTYTSDCIGMDPAEAGTVELGKGPVLCNSPIVAKRLNQKMKECARNQEISVQIEAAGRLSYTDADQIHFSNQGVPVVLVSIPLRYMHMPCEVAQEKDIQDCIDLIAEFLVSY